MSTRNSDETAQLSTLIGVVYDAAIDPGRWPDAIAGACHFLDCAYGVLGAADLLRNDANFMIQWGYPSRDWRNYLDNYFHKNPATPEGFRTKIGEVKTLASLAVYPELLHSEFQTEWAAPLGIVDAVQSTLG